MNILLKKFFIKTFGCQMNYNDSEKISKLLIKNNYKKVDNFEYSNIILINLCSVRNNSFKKIFNYIKNIKIISKKKFLIILTGCIPFLYNEILIKMVNIIINSNNIIYIIKLINYFYYNKCNQISINFYKYINENYIFNNNLKNYFYITIIEGCNKYCSYCIIPYTRGPEISKNLLNILKEIINLNNKIINEIYLIGQNVNSYYGKLKIKSKKFINFYILLNYINQIKFLKLINFITSHPKDFKYNIINLYKFIKLKKYLHLPIQSCSDNILINMKRNYKLIDYKNIVNKLKLIIPSLSISTDIIIGFPGEKYKDFNKNLIFIEKFLFDKSYIFIYNPRPYTLSLKYNDFNSLNLKKNRLYIIKKKIKNNIYYINKMMLYKIEIILIKFINFKKKNLFFGFSDNNRLISLNFEFKNFNILNKFVKVKIFFIKKNIFFSKFYDL